MPDPDVTPVIFRVWPEGDVIAIFPELAYSRDGHLCMSYQHVGQHGGADCELVTKATRPATRAEYTELANELTQRGYNLVIRRRETPAMVAKRKENAKR